jgi:endoglucanase
VTQSSQTVTATAPPHATSLAAGASASIGFVANGTATTPAAVALNGTSCT